MNYFLYLCRRYYIIGEMKKYLLLLLAAMTMAACNDEDDNIPYVPVEELSTTLIYMAADNTLSAYAPDDIMEIKEASKKLSNNQNIVLFVDMANSYGTYIGRVKNGELVDSVAMDEKASGDPAVLEEMLRYTREKYPAKDYGLCLWGHACGILYLNDTLAYAAPVTNTPAATRAITRATTRVFGQDSNPKSIWMNIPSMVKAIENGMGGDHLRYVFADCCNFSCVEIAYELRHITDYLISSPAEIPDRGAPYHTVLPALFNMSENFYERVVDAYFDYYLDEYKTKSDYYYMYEPGDLAGYSVPLSVLKSSELDNLAQETSILLNTMHDLLTPESDRGDVWQYIIRHYTNILTVDFHYDMYNFMKKYAQLSDFERWQVAYEKAVPYRRSSGEWLTMDDSLKDYLVTKGKDDTNCGLVSMFFPMDKYNDTKPSQNLSIRNYQWNNVIRWQDYGW